MTTCGDRRCQVPAHQRDDGGAYRMHAYPVERRDYGPPTLRGMVRAASSREAVVFGGIISVVLAACIIGVRA